MDAALRRLYRRQGRHGPKPQAPPRQQFGILRGSVGQDSGRLAAADRCGKGGGNDPRRYRQLRSSERALRHLWRAANSRMARALEALGRAVDGWAAVGGQMTETKLFLGIAGSHRGT